MQMNDVPFRMTRRRFLSAAAGAALAAAAVPAASLAKPAGDGRATSDVLRVFLASTKGASGHFKETVLGKDGKPRSSAEGEFAFLRPGRFRWVYRKPFSQTIVCDGKKLWLYDEELMQVTVKPIGASLPQTPAAILFGNDDLEKDWNLKAEAMPEGATKITAEPKKEGGFASVELLFAASGLPQEMVLCDLFGQRTRYEFTAFEQTIPDEALFVFVPPKGVDVSELGADAAGSN